MPKTDQEPVVTTDEPRPATNSDQAAPVQYIVHSASLKGLRGWLLFFMVCFAIGGLIHIGQFFNTLNDLRTPGDILNVIATPLLAILSLGTVVLISLQRAIGRWSAIATYVTGAIYLTISTIITVATAGNHTPTDVFDTQPSATQAVASVVVGWVVTGLLSLYFMTSRRVKETLVN